MLVATIINTILSQFLFQLCCELFFQLLLDLFRLSEYNYSGFLYRDLRGVFMNGYITVQEAAVKWGITPRQVQILCKENRIDGATRMSRIWIIPENAKKPTSDKRKAAYDND